MSRSIRTRLFESVALEIGHYIDQLSNADDYGALGARRVFPYPFLPGEQIVPRQINVNAAPFSFDQDVGGVTDSTYDFEIVFVFPLNILKFAVGQNAKTYFDDIDGLRIWLFNGGSVPNKNGRLQDPDNAGQLINNRISAWREQLPRATVAGIEVPIIVEFESREDREGQRI